MKRLKYYFLPFILFLLISLQMQLFAQKVNTSQFSKLTNEIQKRVNGSAAINGRIKLDSAFVYQSDVVLYYNSYLSEYPLRESLISNLLTSIDTLLPADLLGKRVRIVSNRSAIEELALPKLKEQSSAKLRDKKSRERVQTNFIANLSKPYTTTQGLKGRNIALWQSHGYYYEQSLYRWEWQRARIFQTVEDLFTQSFVLPFLVPMLENAGATLMLPRERDFNTDEYLCDYDIKGSGYREVNGTNKWEDSGLKGFANTKPYYLFGENPFEEGRTRIVKSIKKGEESKAIWPVAPAKPGEYALYVSYSSFPNSTKEAKYIVSHGGNSTTISVNQQIGGGTWIYLGKFYFTNNAPYFQGVELGNISDKADLIISADGVKIGGGFGNIARAPEESPLIDVTPQVSGYPRFTEAARYWLQWAGFNDTIYSSTNNKNDYNDDYTSRGRWVNVLAGGSAVNPKERGYGIPIDMAFAFHSDAGTTLNDSIIGTLGIYTRYSQGSDKFPDGSERLHSRYLTDLVQTEIVEDIRELYDSKWQRRGIWDKSYAESRTPVVPTMLLELLSHQNFADMRYGLDPQFRFDVSRAIYKGILKFLSWRDDLPYQVQPLPIQDFSISLMAESNKLELKWREREDRLEPSAKPTGYIVYTRVDNGSFDNGVVTKEEKIILSIEEGKLYSFKVSALNEGGESFCSEILSAYKAPNSKGTALIINGFDRVSAPYSFASKDSLFAGFDDRLDAGVPYLYDISYIGSQYEYRREIPWMDDDSPGFGASYSNYETTPIAGNSFDYPALHGRAISSLGYSFISTSRDGLNLLDHNPAKFAFIDLILGKQKPTIAGRGEKGVKFPLFTHSLMEYLTQYANLGGNILVSGSDVATALWDSFLIDTTAQNFAKNLFKYQWRTNQATYGDGVKSAPNPFGLEISLSINNRPNIEQYSCESPDGIEPSEKNAYTIARYSDNNISAGVAYKERYKSVVLGFPIESIKREDERIKLISNILEFFNN